MKITEFKSQVLGVILNGNNYSADMSSTSKIKVALGGITPPAPLAPYARSGGIINVAFDPTFNKEIPSSHPLITLPLPN